MLKAPKEHFSINRTDVCHMDDIWGLSVIDSNDYGPVSNRGYIYVLVLIDNFIKLDWTVPSKNFLEP